MLKTMKDLKQLKLDSENIKQRRCVLVHFGSASFLARSKNVRLSSIVGKSHLGNVPQCQDVELRARIYAKADRQNSLWNPYQLSNVDYHCNHAVKPYSLWCGDFRTRKGHFMDHQSGNLMDEQHVL